MNKKILSLIIVFILLISSFAVYAECPPTCSDEEWGNLNENDKFSADPQKAFDEKPTSDNFARSKVSKTSENLQKIEKPTLVNFESMQAAEQSKYLESKYSLDFADSYFTTGTLISAPVAANKYLQDKLGNKEVKFVITHATEFTDKPPKLTVGGKSLTLVTGTEASGKVPPGTTKISFDDANNRFVFDPRLTIEGEEMILQSDGSIRFRSPGQITDSTNGAVIDIREGSIVKFTKDGISVDGQAVGLWKDELGNTNRFVNFEGKLTISQKLVACDNCKVNYQGKDINGRFLANFEKGKLVHVVLLNSQSSYKDSHGKFAGRGNIEFDNKGQWKKVETAGLAEMNFGKTGKHHFNGEFNVDFKDNQPIKARIQPSGTYADLEFEGKHLFLEHNSQAANLKFGAFSAADVSKEITNLKKGESLAFIDSKGSLFGRGKLEFNTPGFEYEGEQDTAGFARSIKDKQEYVRITSEEEGNVGKFTKKTEIVKLFAAKGRLYTKETAGITSLIKNKDGKLSMELDKKSLQLLKDITNDPKRFISSEIKLVVELGNKDAFFAMSSEHGMIYQSKEGKQIAILSPMEVHDITGTNLLDINKEISDLNNQLKSEKDTAKAKEILQKRDSLEYLVHQDKIQGLISTKNYADVIEKTKAFLAEHKGSPIEAKVKFTIGEFYAAKAIGADIKQSASGGFALPEKSSFTSELYYKTQFKDGKEKVTHWSPDNINWIPITKTVIPKDFPVESLRGYSPAEKNIVLISDIVKAGGAIRVLEDAAKERGVKLRGGHSKPTASYLAAQKDFDKAITYLQSAKQDTDVNIEATLALGGVYTQKGDSQHALKEYKSLTDNSDPSIKSQGYIGMAIAHAQLNDIAEALRQSQTSMEIDPNNKVARAINLQLQNGVINAVDKALAAEGEALNDKFMKKLGLEGYEGGFLDYAGQIIGNTGRIITDPITGMSGNLVIILKGARVEIGEAQGGANTLKIANSKGYTLNDVKDMDTNQRKKLIKEIYGTEDSKKFNFFNRGINSMLRNPDIVLATQNGKLTQSQLKTGQRVLSEGKSYTFSYEHSPELSATPKSYFMFKQGENYLTVEGLEYTWRDSVFEGVDLKNAAMIALPMAKVGQGVTWSVGLARGAQAVKLAQSQTVASALLGLAAKGGKSLIGAEKIARLAEGGSALKHTIGSTKIAQILTKTYGSGGFIDKSITFAGRLGVGEAGEETLGWGVGKVVGTVKPEWAASASILTSTFAGHGGAFDDALEGLETVVRQASNTGDVKRIIFGSAGEVLGESAGVFTNKQVRDTFIDNIKLQAKTAGKSFDKLRDGIFKLEGRTYLAGVVGADLPTIGGIKAVGVADINPEVIESIIKAKFEQAQAAMKQKRPDFFDSFDRTPIPPETRNFPSSEPNLFSGTSDEIITASRAELGNIDEFIKKNHFDDIAYRQSGYGSGSQDTIESLFDSEGKSTLAYLELSELSHANSLKGGHEIGNTLVRDSNHAVKDTLFSFDPDAIVFRGPNGAIIIKSDKLSSQDILDAIPSIEKNIKASLPSDFPDRGITGKLRAGTTAMDTTGATSRESTKQLYYDGLQKAGAAAEYGKTVEGVHDFESLIQGKTGSEISDFLFDNHNFIPPEAEAGTLFLVKDQIDSVEGLRREVSGLESLFDAGDTSVQSQLDFLRPQLDTEATKLVAMFKRPARFESNVEAVFKGQETPILNFKASDELQKRFIVEGIPFYRVDGDLDHLRDVFKTYKVTGADDHYAAFYTETAKSLKQYENQNPGVRAFLEKQSSSDEFALIIAGANKEQATQVMELTRQTMENVGKRQTFTKIHKVTGQLIEPNGGTTTTLGSNLQEITLLKQLDQARHTNDAIVNLRKYIPGKNTIGSFDSITSGQANGIMNTLDSYRKTNNLDALKEAKESLNSYRSVLENKGVSSTRIDALLTNIDQSIKQNRNVATRVAP